MTAEYSLQTLEYQQQKEAIDPEPSFRLLKKYFLIVP
jgi:hypothetical protein